MPCHLRRVAERYRRTTMPKYVAPGHVLMDAREWQRVSRPADLADGATKPERHRRDP